MNSKSRTQNSVRNTIYGLIVVLLNVVISFATRTFLVKCLGIEVLGLNGLFTEVIAMMSLAELGVGMAIVYSLYQPLYKSDYKKISQLMSLFRSAYLFIALGTFIIGILMLPFIHLLITDIDYPLIYIRFIFFLFVINTSCSYLFSYKTALLNADQKQYIVSIYTALIKLLFSGIIIALLIITKNYILFLVINIFQVVVANLLVSRYVDNHYSFLNYEEKLEKCERKEVFENIKNIFIKKLSGVITTSTDNILISTLVSTIQVGYYSNYVMLFSPIKIFRSQLTNSITASIGNLSVSESPDKCIVVLKRLTFLYFGFSCIVSTVLLAVSNVFITIWLGSEFVMGTTIVSIAILNLFLDICGVPLWQYLEVSGLFRQDKNIAILGSVVNIIVSIIFGIKIGVAGIFLGTVCTQIIQFILKTRLLFDKKYNLSSTSYFLMLLKVFLGFLIAFVVQIFFISELYFNDIYTELFMKFILALSESLLICFVLFRNSSELSYCLELICSYFKRNKK